MVAQALAGRLEQQLVDDDAGRLDAGLGLREHALALAAKRGEDLVGGHERGLRAESGQRVVQHMEQADTPAGQLGDGDRLRHALA